MKNKTLRLLITCLLLLPTVLIAGIDEVVAAYNKQDYATALRELQPLANNGDAFAQSGLGEMYYNGKGVPQDYKEAMKWYRLAADQGDADAQFNVGVMYDNGQGVPQDYKEAVKLYRLAADQGNPGAQSNLGTMYYNGTGVPQDYKEAVKWYRLAADQGNAEAQSNLNAMNNNIQPVKENPGFNFLSFWKIVIAIGVIQLIMWIYSIVDVLKSDFKEGFLKIVWLIAIIFLPLFGVILYLTIGRGQKKTLIYNDIGGVR